MRLMPAINLIFLGRFIYKLILFVASFSELAIGETGVCEWATEVEPKCLSGKAPARRSRDAREVAASNSMKLSKTLNVFMPLSSLFRSGKKSECRAFLRQCLDDKTIVARASAPVRF
jgi:hypothetical protein